MVSLSKHLTSHNLPLHLPIRAMEKVETTSTSFIVKIYLILNKMYIPKNIITAHIAS